MAAKIFEVNDVLPATTQLRVHFNGGVNAILEGMFGLKSDNNNFEFITEYNDEIFGFHDGEIYLDIWNNDEEIWVSPFNGTTHNYMDIDTSTWSESKRTISNVGDSPFTWEDVAPSGYTISFNSNGGTTFSDIEEATELPTLPTPTKENHSFLGWYYDSGFTNEAVADDPLTTDVILYAKWELNTYTITYNSNGGTSVSQATGVTTLPSTLPTPTKSGYTFVAWYYESNFQTRAKAGDTIEANTTLYAKWHNLGSLFTEIADAIREKESSSGTIRDLDFGERITALPSPKEEETKTVTPNFSSGNEVITPTSGKVLSKVTINKDSNLVASNIKKDVTTFGITGTSYIAIELTQAQYEALSVYDDNTYYLIVEDE